MERWWHLYAGVCEHGVYVAAMAGDTPIHPEQMLAELLATRSWAGYTSPVAACEPGCTVDLHYVRSWNHEPSDAEWDAATTRAVPN